MANPTQAPWHEHAMERQIGIRPAGHLDLPRLTAINAEGRPGVSAMTAAEFESALATATPLLVAGRGGEICAYLIAYSDGADYDGEEFRWLQARYQGFLYIDQIAVSRDARRCRAGSLLYAEVERIARDRGKRWLLCEVNRNPPNPLSLAFHQRQGFIEVGSLTTRDGRRVALMEKHVIILYQHLN